MSETMDDNLTPALKQYLDIRKNIDPAQEVRRRAKNIGMRLIRLYADAAPKASDIKSKIASLNGRVKIRPKIAGRMGKNGKRISRKQAIARETKARIAALKLTAAGWFVPVKYLGGQPRVKGRKPMGTFRGALNEKLSGSNPSEELINLQLGAAQTDARAGGGVQKSCDAEAEDIQKYLDRKTEEAKQKAGLTH